MASAAGGAALGGTMVGATGFEPATTGPPVRCATGLRYAPMSAETLVYTTPSKGWWAGRESNPEHRDYKSRVLAALNYRPVRRAQADGERRINVMAPAAGEAR